MHTSINTCIHLRNNTHTHRYIHTKRCLANIASNPNTVQQLNELGVTDLASPHVEAEDIECRKFALVLIGCFCAHPSAKVDWTKVDLISSFLRLAADDTQVIQ